MRKEFSVLALSLLLNGFCLSLLSAIVYRQRLQIDLRFFSYLSDEVALGATLSLMTLLCSLPGLLLSGIALKFGHPRLGRFLIGSWIFALNLYLLADTVALSVSGSHLLYFLGYVSDILAHPELEGLAWIGGTKGLIVPSLGIIAASFGTLVVSFLAAQRLLNRDGNSRYIVATSLSFIGLLVLSPWLWSDLLIATAVYQQLPVPTSSLREVVRQRFSQGVKIVELTNSLTKDDSVVIRNFGPPVELEGWQVRTRSAQHSLKGALSTDQELTFSADFAHDVDWLVLVDPKGGQHDTLQYTPGIGEWVASLPYHRGDPKPLAPAIAKLQEALQHGVEHSPPPDPNPKVTNPKHVVLILLESFRRDAVSPEKTPNLTQWSQRGLSMSQHISGSNGTHLSLYSLLFGRSATYYRRDLSVWTVPQMIATFKASGYQTSYFSSATSVGWMWMERMLDPRFFDRIELGQEHRSVDQWHRWNSKDADYFAEIPKLLKTSERPQLVVLFAMSTHYPYPFPKEFDLNQPSLGDALHSQALTNASQELLKNRYANAVAYLDSLIGELLDNLDLDNTIVVITGDHGEGLWDDGSAAHGTRASEVQVAVPCLVLGGDIPAKEISYPSYHADVLPTLLHALEGQPVTIQASHGVSLLASTERDSVPVTPVVSYPPYELALFSGQERIKLSIATNEWLSGRIGLGILKTGLNVSFAGQLGVNGIVRGGVVENFDFASWSQRILYWADILKT